MAVMALTVNAKDYTDQLVVSVNGMATPAQETTISVNEQEDGKYTLTLKDFSFSGMVNVGTIEVSDIETTEEKGIKSFSVSKNITIQEGSEGTDWSMAGQSMPIELTGKMTDDKLYAVININFMGLMQIAVTFGDDNFPVTYSDNMIVDMGSGFSDPMPATISVQKQSDGKYTLSVKNFQFELAPGFALGIGNITATDIEGVEENGVVKLSADDKAITIEPGDDPNVDWSMGEQFAQAGLTIDLDAEMTAEKLNAKLFINEANVTVVFGEEYITAGIDTVTVTPNASGVDEIYDLSGRKLNSLQKGVNIVRKADGTTVKVLKK